MSNIVTNAQKSFDSALKVFGAANSIKVALENIDAPTSTDIPYLASYLLDLDLTEADLSVNERADTIYQIDVRYASHLGSSDINAMTDLLRAKFKLGSCHSWDGDCFCVDSISVSPLPVNDGWARKSISLTVSAYTPRL